MWNKNFSNDSRESRGQDKPKRGTYSVVHGYWYVFSNSRGLRVAYFVLRVWFFYAPRTTHHIIKHS